MSTPIVQTLEARAHRHSTPCGDGDLVWREWGQGPTVVLQHGGFGSWLHWVRNIDALAARARVLAVDLPGLGDSALPNEPPSPASIAQPVARGLQQLLPAGEACDLVGFSFGGLIAGQVAATLGSRIRSLTLVGSSGLGLPRERIDLVRRTPDMDREALRAAQLHNLRTLMVFDPTCADTLALEIQDHNDARARVKSRSMSLGSSLRDVLPSVTAHLNGIWGEHDVTAVPRLHARRELLAQLKPDLDFQVIPGAGHWVQYEASERFNAVLIDRLSA